MSNVISFPKPGIGQPEWRSALLAEAIRHTAHVAGPICPFALFRHLVGWLGSTEEECGLEVSKTICLLLRSGLYTSNTFDAASGIYRLAAHTLYTPSETLTVYLHDDLDEDPDEDDAA